MDTQQELQKQIIDFIKEGDMGLEDYSNGKQNALTAIYDHFSGNQPEIAEAISKWAGVQREFVKKPPTQ